MHFIGSRFRLELRGFCFLCRGVVVPEKALSFHAQAVGCLSASDKPV